MEKASFTKGLKPDVVTSLQQVCFPSSSSICCVTKITLNKSFQIFKYELLFCYDSSFFKLLSPSPPSPSPPLFFFLLLSITVFIFCSFQTEWQTGRPRSGTLPAAPPSSWRGFQTGWCHYRTSSSSRTLEGRSHPHPRDWCCWNGGTPPERETRRWGWKVLNVQMKTKQTDLQVFHVWKALGDTFEAVVVQVQLSQHGQVWQAAIFYVTDVVVAEAQSGK